jgi:hypothetical protein
LVVATAACGGNASGSGGESPAAGGAGAKAGSSGSGGGSGVGGSGIGGIAGTGTSGGGGIAPDSVTLEMGPFEVAAGSDTYRCQNFANPFGGVDVEIVEFESHMSEGSHHLILNYADYATSTGIVPCGGLEAPQGPYTTQAKDDKLTYPEGVGAFLGGSQGLRINSHYVNTTIDPFQAQITITLRRAATGTVRARAYSTFALDLNVNVQPGQTGYASGSVSLADGATLLWLLPHMHWHGTRFTVTMGAQTIFETNDWETPPFPFTPPLAVPAGQSLEYRCEYFNGESVPLTFGESATTNEMCVLVVQYYYAQDL